MGRIFHSLIWAGAILIAALISSGSGLSDDASFAVVLGLSGAAWASLTPGNPCTRGGLQ